MSQSEVTPEDVLARVAKYAAFIRISCHALKQMLARGARHGDVTRALKTSKSAVYRADEDTWRIEGGVDLDGDSLALAVALKPSGDVVVTVFGKD